MPTVCTRGLVTVGVDHGAACLCSHWLGPHLKGCEVASQLLYYGLQCTGLGSGVTHKTQVEEQSISAVLLVFDTHRAANELLLHGRPAGREVEGGLSPTQGQLLGGSGEWGLFCWKSNA